MSAHLIHRCQSEDTGGCRSQVLPPTSHLLHRDPSNTQCSQTSEVRQKGLKYEIEYKPTDQQGNADALSRLTIESSIWEEYQDGSTTSSYFDFSPSSDIRWDLQKQLYDILKRVMKELLDGKIESNPMFKRDVTNG